MPPNLPEKRRYRLMWIINRQWRRRKPLWPIPRYHPYINLQGLRKTIQNFRHDRWVRHVWNVMAHAQKPDLVFPRNGRVHLNWRGVSVQSTAGSRGVRISGSNAGYTVFWGRVQDYRLPTPLACFPFTSPTVRRRVPSGSNWAPKAW